MRNMLDRRMLLKYGTAAAAYSALENFALGQGKTSSQQRAVVIMFDGFDPRYLAASKMPVLDQWKREGIFKPVKGMMPSVTNVNNASICCGVWPERMELSQILISMKNLAKNFMSNPPTSCLLPRCLNAPRGTE
jgi:hypothetical protein